MLNMPETALWCHREREGGRERERERERVGGDRRSRGRESEWQPEGRAKARQWEKTERSGGVRDGECERRAGREVCFSLPEEPGRSAVSCFFFCFFSPALQWTFTARFRVALFFFFFATDILFFSLSPPLSLSLCYIPPHPHPPTHTHTLNTQEHNKRTARHNWWVRAPVVAVVFRLVWFDSCVNVQCVCWWTVLPCIMFSQCELYVCDPRACVYINSFCLWICDCVTVCVCVFTWGESECVCVCVCVCVWTCSFAVWVCSFE